MLLIYPTYKSIIKLDLITLTSSNIKTYTLPIVKISFNPDFSRIAVQSLLGVLTVYTYPLFSQ